MAVEIKSSTQLDQVFKSRSQEANVVYFWADWAEPCKQMDAVVAQLVKELPGSCFCRIEAEPLPDLSERFSVTCVPSFVFLKGGEEVDRLEGADVPALTKKAREHENKYSLKAGAGATGPVSDAQASLEERLDKLISTADVMLFMKGNPAAPECGFSNKICGILADHDIRYGSFNILQDDEVRQGLKKYKNWPTYPQLYAKGELIGGLDIIKELVDEGELKDALGVSAQAVPAPETIHQKIDRLVSEKAVMLFMKGVPDAPQCGFSNKIIQILNAHNATFGHFNIFDDEEVRQELKAYKNWPTYPQLYVKGELIGGLDIVKELDEEGELKDMLTV